MDGTVRLFLLLHVLTSLTAAMPAMTSTDERRLDESAAVYTRRGCRVSLKCAGVGIDVKWEDLEHFKSSIRSNTTTTNATQSFPRYISHDVEMEFFEHSDEKKSKILACKVINDGLKSKQNNILLTVSPEVIAVSTAAPSIDITGYYIGDTRNISCFVETCLENVTVSLYKANQQIGKLISLGTERITYDFDIIIDKHTTDSYACAVDAWGDLGTHSVVHKFKVVGTPKNRPTSRRH